jgi:hypothetical protein
MCGFWSRFFYWLALWWETGIQGLKQAIGRVIVNKRLSSTGVIMSKLLICLIALIVLIGSFQGSNAPKVQAQETQPVMAESGRIPKELEEQPRQWVVNFNFNVNKLVPGVQTVGRSQIETLKQHVLKVERKGEFIWVLVEDAGMCQWNKISLDGLKFKQSDDVAWNYQEFDVYDQGKLSGKDRVLTVHKNNFDSVVNLTEGVRVP